MTDLKWKDALWNLLGTLRLRRLTARVALSGDAFETAWVEGGALTLDEAIAEASGEVTPRASAP